MRLSTNRTPSPTRHSPKAAESEAADGALQHRVNDAIQKCVHDAQMLRLERDTSALQSGSESPYLRVRVAHERLEHFAHLNCQPPVLYMLEPQRVYIDVQIESNRNLPLEIRFPMAAAAFSPGKAGGAFLVSGNVYATQRGPGTCE